MKERETPEEKLRRRQNRIEEFLESGIEGNISRFPIKGHYYSNLGKLTAKLYVAYFPKPDQPSRSELFESSYDPMLNINRYRQKIFELVVPPFMQDWEEDNSRLKSALERKASNEGYPTQVLVFGNQRGLRDELVVLSSIKKVSAQKALFEIQNALRRKLQR